MFLGGLTISMSERKTERLIFTLYILGFVIMAGTLAFTQPLADTSSALANPPDEHARFLVPWYICRYGSIPNAYNEEIRIPSYGFSYALYNVFPYIVQGYVMRFFHFFTKSQLIMLYVGRAVNILFGTGMAVMVYRISKLLFDEKKVRWLFCFFITYLPQNIFIHSYINTDSMALLSTAIIFYAWIRGYKEDFSIKACIWLSVGISLCALSYYNAYGFILSSILIFIGYFIKNKRLKEMFKKGAFISVIVMLGIGWWFIRSFILYEGDVLGLATREKMASMYAIPELNPLTMSTFQNRGESIFTMIFETPFLAEIAGSFIARFGSMSIGTSKYIYLAYYIILIIGLLSALIFVKRRDKSYFESIPKGQRIFLNTNMIFCIIMPIILLIDYAYTMDYQNQGRYILPALIPLMYYVVLGISKLLSILDEHGKLQTVVYTGLIIFPVASSLWITYHRALPIYLEVGMKLQ